MGAFRGRRT